MVGKTTIFLVLTFLVGQSLACLVPSQLDYAFSSARWEDFTDKPTPATPIIVVVTTTPKPIWRRFPSKMWGSRGQYSKPSWWPEETIEKPSRADEQRKPFRISEQQKPSSRFYGERKSFYERWGFHPEEINDFDPEETNGFNLQETMSKMFNIVDKDGDGRISFQDFLDTSIVLFSKDRTNDKLRTIFDKCDNDKSGSIDKAELSELMNSIEDITKKRNSFDTQIPQSGSTTFSRKSTIQSRIFPARIYDPDPPKRGSSEYYRRLSDYLSTDKYGPRKEIYWKGQPARSYVAPIEPIFVDGKQVYP